MGRVRPRSSRITSCEIGKKIGFKPAGGQQLEKAEDTDRVILGCLRRVASDGLRAGVRTGSEIGTLLSLQNAQCAIALVGTSRA